MVTGPALLQQIVLGLDGVTAGPWREDTHLCCIVGHKGEIICGPANCSHIIATQPDAIREIAAYVRDLEERLAKAAEALEPFAKVEPMDVYEDEDEDARGSYILTQSDFRRARTALSQIRSEK